MNGIAILGNNGYILFNQINKSQLEMIFHLHNFDEDSTHAIHIHEFGDTSDGCTSLGGHYNPDNKNHGRLGSQQRHKGDLFNNFTTDENGFFHKKFVENNIHLSDLFGRSIVIHYLQDDYGSQTIDSIPYKDLSDKILIKLCQERGYKNLRSKQERIDKLNSESLITGNAGKRLVCGIIARRKNTPHNRFYATNHVHAFTHVGSCKLRT
jgi:Cu-Zn family superoxide dismutase